MVVSVVLPGLAKAQQKGSFCEGIASQNRILSADNPCVSGPPKAVVKTVYGLEVFADTRHDAQVFFKVNRGKLLFLNQNRTTIDGKSKFSHIGLGIKIKPVKNVTTSFTYGPQFTYERGHIDRTVLFATAMVGNTRDSITIVNRFSFGHISKTPFSNRHLQILKQGRLPDWLCIQAEELHSIGKWRELFLGIKISFGGLMIRRGFLKNLYAYPMWDFAKGNFDTRIGYALSF